MKLNVDVKQLTVPKRIELVVAALLLVYATVGIHHLREVDSYMEFFDDKAVRMVSVALVCAVGYANPQLGILLAVCLFRTVDIVAERFEIIEVNPKKPPNQLISTDGSIHQLKTPGRFPNESGEKGHVQVLEKAGDDVDKITSELLGLKFAGDESGEVSLESQFGQSLAAPPAGSSVAAAPAPPAAPEVVQVVPEPAADSPMVPAENADKIDGPAPGAPATVPMASAAPAVDASGANDVESFGW